MLGMRMPTVLRALIKFSSSPVQQCPQQKPLLVLQLTRFERSMLRGPCIIYTGTYHIASGTNFFLHLFSLNALISIWKVNLKMPPGKEGEHSSLDFYQIGAW